MKQALIIGALMLLAMQLPDLLALRFASVDYDPDVSGPVTLYATRWCGYCAKTRKLLNEHDIPFTEFDVEQSSDAARQMMTMSAYGVPVIVIGDTVIKGYRPNAILAALDSG